MAERQVPRRGDLRGVPGLVGALALWLGLACAAGGGRGGSDGGPEAPLRLDVPAAVGWEPGGPFELALELHNASGYAMSLARPRADALEVKLLRATDGSVACRTPSPTRQQQEGWEVVRVPASSGVPLRVDVSPYCRDLAPGVYRYEAVFVANPAQGGAGIAYTGTLGPRGGRVAVGAGLSRDPGALAAALGAPPPAGGQPAPPAAGPSGTGAAGADTARACVDRELSRRGLNAYGDPQGTRYAGGPPADEGGRVLYVAGRDREIREACGIAPP